MHPHTLTLLVTVTLVLAVLVGLVLGIDWAEAIVTPAFDASCAGAIPSERHW